MEFIKIRDDRFLVKDSNGIIVDEKEKLQLEKKELVIKDFNSNTCQSETTKRIKKINKKLEATDGTGVVEETAKSVE